MAARIIEAWTASNLLKEGHADMALLPKGHGAPSHRPSDDLLAAKTLARARITITFVFAFTALLLIGALHVWLESIVVVGSLAGSVVVAFGMPESDMARPRSLLGGHAISCLTGILISCALHDSPWAAPLAVSIALILMQLTVTIHSPAGADPLIIIASKGSWWHALWVLMLGLLSIYLLAQGYRRIVRALTPTETASTLEADSKGCDKP